MPHDVVIVGGGPAGSTLAGFLRLYAPEMSVLVLERERFPRDHVGESQLPPITRILEELGVWDECEAAGFPIKTGAIYRWGRTDELWRFDFLLGQEFDERPRPQKLRGQRKQTTFHVDRAVYDEILLNHAARLGAEVRQEARVASVERDGDRIVALVLADGERIEGGAFVDASGHGGVLRRAMGVRTDAPTALRNIALWDYWRKPEWADTVARGGVRVRVMSLGYGWLWFIPIGEDRVSVGLVTHADHFKASGLKPADLYARAIAEEPIIAELMAGAESEGRFATTKDWSFLAERTTGENWWLVGESAGFADPILAAGMTLAQVGARELAHLLVARHRETHAQGWLDAWYDEITRRRIRQHIRFADYWYSANERFTDLKAYTAEIARENGLSLDPEEGFRWLAAGGFASDDLTSAIVGNYQLGSVKFAMQTMTGLPAEWRINGFNEYRLNLAGATKEIVPICREGRIETIECYRRGASLLPLAGMFQAVYFAVSQEREAGRIVANLRRRFAADPRAWGPEAEALSSAFDVLEGWLAEGWITGKLDRRKPTLSVYMDESSVRVGG